jgi:hypothetical protein
LPDVDAMAISLCAKGLIAGKIAAHLAGKDYGLTGDRSESQ